LLHTQQLEPDPPALFASVIFQIGSCAFAQLGPLTVILLLLPAE
jgi:hypothetical protein